MNNLLKITIINFNIFYVNAILNFRCDKSICVTKETQVIYHEIDNKTSITLNGCEMTTHYRDVTEIQIFWPRRGITKNFREFERVKIFKIRYGQLRNLKTFLIFDGLNELKVLRLTDNEIEKIESFPKLEHVINLNLSKNRLKFIDENYFANLVNLRLLTLEDNQISLIHPNSFEHNLKLEEINLNRNKLKSLDFLIFIKNQQLKEISLNHNEIDSFMSNEKIIENLQTLNMRGNKINKLHQKMIPTNLKWIDLSENVITYVPSNFYDDLTHVKFIDFSHNICVDQTYPIDADFIHLREQTRKNCHHLAVLFFKLDE